MEENNNSIRKTISTIRSYTLVLLLAYLLLWFVSIQAVVIVSPVVCLNIISNFYVSQKLISDSKNMTKVYRKREEERF